MTLASREWPPIAANPGELAFTLPFWTAAYATVFLAALGLRAVGLDAPPLAPDEAAVALEARAIWRGNAGDYTSAPLLANLLSLSFALFSAADAAARAPSALAGCAVSLTPLLFRARLGSVGTLGSCALLAISPLGLVASRSANAAALVALAAALAAGCALRAFDRADGRWLLGCGVAIGLGLGASPAFVGSLAALAAAAALSGVFRASSSSVSLQFWVPRAVVAGLAAAFVFDTLLLTRPSGFQAGLVDSLFAWPGLIGASSTTLFAASLFALQEPLLIVLALTSLPTAFSSRFGRFLAVWALVSVVLALASRAPDLQAITPPGLPLALLAGIGITRLSWLGRCRRPAVSLTAVAILVPIVLLILGANASVHRGTLPSAALLAVAVGSLIAIALVATAWLDTRDLRAAMGLAIGLGLVILQVSFTARLNYGGFERGGPLLFQASSRPELRLVEERARDWWRQDPGAPISVDASLRPYLEWSLRHGPPIEWISVAPRSVDRVILGPDTAAGRATGDWLRVVISERYNSPSEPPDVRALWRWIVQRAPSGGLVGAEQHAILVSP